VTALHLPLHEFDDDSEAVFGPLASGCAYDLPKRAVVSWFGNVVMARTADMTPVLHLTTEHGPHDVWVLGEGDDAVALMNPGVGAPLAASCFDTLIANGCTTIIGCGGAGSLVPGQAVGHVIVPTSAIRDEGTSYHYAPAHDTVAPHKDSLDAIVSTLVEAGVPHDLGMTWTTDGLFRETRAKVIRRREQGCLVVEMEAAAMFAVAAFRGVRYGQMLYAGDDVSADEWDHRHWNKQATVRERLLDLAFTAVRSMAV
jgi:uridine phosphorylase